MLREEDPTYEALQQVRWTRKGLFRGNPSFPETVPLRSLEPSDRDIEITLTRNDLVYHNGKWNDLTNTDRVPTTINPIVSENICLRKRVETLIRTAAISDIEVQQLKQEIQEAQEILAQLAQVL
jgi:hypothetical protein